MKPIVAAVLATLFLAAGTGAVSARVTTCARTSLVFYTTDTSRLAAELAKFPSSCADYYISITPTATGAPRGGAPLASLRALGPNFHALAEIRLNAWSAYAATNGWSAAGIEARREMTQAGYDPSLGDTWAVNEVGAPSPTQMGVDVMNGTGTARDDFRAFVRALYTGDQGVTDQGVVFAADPLQVTDDLTDYTRRLDGWYASDSFWQEMDNDVRFWAQETYADARAWGVDGATLDQRTAYLDDYFMHGTRIAGAGGTEFAAAGHFLEHAYLPLGNASYRWPAPDPSTGIGFGSTDVDLPTMESFVAAQVDALRAQSAMRFGFAVVPKSAAPSDALAVDDRVAASIQASDTNRTEACGADGSLCTGSVAGAAFNQAWKAFANTLEGTHVVVHPGFSTQVIFAAVTARGETQVDLGPITSVPKGYLRLAGAVTHDIETSATYARPLQVCLGPPLLGPRHPVRIFRLAPHGWVGLKTRVAVNWSAFFLTTTCATTAELGTFAAFERRKAAA